jgi:hypothetical protein
LSIGFQDIINSNFRKLIQDVLELVLQGEEDIGDLVAGGIEVQFHSSNVHEDDTLLVRVQFREQLVQVSLDVISNSGFLGGGVASLVRAGLEDLDDSERSEELAITLEFAEDFSSDVIGISIQAREIVEQVDEVSEVERLGLDEIFNFAVKLGEVFFRDVGGEFANLESSEPEQEIEDFIFIKFFKILLCFSNQSMISLIFAKGFDLRRAGELDESSKNSKSEDDVLILVQADVLVHDVKKIIDIASIGDSRNQTLVASNFFKLDLLLFRKVSAGI